MCFFSSCLHCLKMYWCNFNYNCVRFYTLNCVLNIFLVFLVALNTRRARLIDNRNLAQMTRDAQHRQPRPLKNG